MVWSDCSKQWPVMGIRVALGMTQRWRGLYEMDGLKKEKNRKKVTSPLSCTHVLLHIKTMDLFPEDTGTIIVGQMVSSVKN